MSSQLLEGVQNMTFEEDLYSEFPTSKDEYVRFKNRIVRA